MNTLTVDNPHELNADHYSIRNVLGQVVKEGSLATGSQNIRVTNIANGSYVMVVSRSGFPVANKIFVKNN